MLKTDIELSGGDQAEAAAKAERVSQISTRAEAEAYAREVYTKAKAVRGSGVAS